MSLWRATAKWTCTGASVTESSPTELSICLIHPHLSTFVPISENHKQNNNLHEQQQLQHNLFFLIGRGTLWDELRWPWLAVFEIARRAKHVVTNVFQVFDNWRPKMRWKAALGFLPGNERKHLGNRGALLWFYLQGQSAWPCAKTDKLLGSLWAVEGERWY